MRGLLGQQTIRWLSKEVLTPPGYTKKSINHLKRFFIDKIRASGPITVAEYMKTSVSAPQVGYYGQFSEKQRVFGDSGDFITSPELTQLFGEMIGVWVFHELANTGYRGPWQLVELGPGRAQLMTDVLSSLEKFQDKDVSVHLVETSDALIEEQERILCVDNSTPPKVFIANEFLDALPIHQFSRNSKNPEVWHETYINLDKHSDDLCFMTSKAENIHSKGLIPSYIREDSSRKTWECSPEAGTVVSQIADRITSFGGFGLLIDYGHDGSRDTHSFRAYKKHQQVDPLKSPGEVDLTADVDFGYLSSLVKETTLVYGPNNQREFLAQLGIEARLRRLLKICKNRSTQEQLIQAYNMLMGDMGEKFKALSIFPKTLGNILEARKGPAGFAQGKPADNKSSS